MNTQIIILPDSWNVKAGQNLLVKKTWTEKFDYAEVEVSDKKHFFFEANGLHLRLSVSERGFNLWDNDNGQWLLDASVVGYLAHFIVGGNDYLRGVVLEKEKPSVGEIQYNMRPKTIVNVEYVAGSRPIKGLIRCSECGTMVDVDDAESSYNAELDDVSFYCKKCMEEAEE